MSNQTYMQTMQALGSIAEFRLVAESMIETEKWFTLLWKEVLLFENNFSRFKPDSELSRVNAQAGEKVTVSSVCLDILQKAKKYGEMTQGVFNPFILPSLQRAGYVHSMIHRDEQAPVYTDRDVVSYSMLEVGGDWVRIPPHTALDLGGIGKGYLADYLAGLLTENVPSFCLSLGGDIIVKGADEYGEKWSIDIQSSIERSESVASFTSDKAMYGIATSGTLREKEGNVQAHQIDTDSKDKAVSPFTMCTVMAQDATTADVFASAILLGGEEYAKQCMQAGYISGVLLQDATALVPLVYGDGFTLKH